MPEAADGNELRKYPQIHRGFRCRARIASQHLKIPERQMSAAKNSLAGKQRTPSWR